MSFLRSQQISVHVNQPPLFISPYLVILLDKFVRVLKILKIGKFSGFFFS